MMKPKSLSEIKIKVEIDEEGFPLFGGLRIDDQLLLEDLFQNMQRFRPEEPRSKIVTQMKATANGRWAWIDAFDEPFVVQSVELLSETTEASAEEIVFRWDCLGDLSFHVKWAELYIDKWERFHAYLGAHEIPAVLSRKAQAQLLNLVTEFDDKHLKSPPLYRSAEIRNERTPREAAFWSESYDSGPGWDIGRAHPYLCQKLNKEDASEADWLSQLAPKESSARLLVPGAGGGHDAHFLSELHGRNTSPLWSVEALDFAEEAIKLFQSQYPDSQVDYKKVDVFDYLKKQNDNSVDAIFEHTFLCAISPEDREEYLKQLHRVLRPGGSYFGLFFLLEHHGGPPFAVTQWELRESLQEKFLIKEWERVTGISSDELGGRVYKELWARFTKKVL